MPRRAHRVVASVTVVLVLAGALVAALESGSADRPKRPAQTRQSAVPRRPPTAEAKAQAQLPTAGCGRPPREHLITRPRWVSSVAITEYYSSPERWFVGKRVPTPGLSGRHPVDWLYSTRGLAMEGDGIAADGRNYHIDNVGSGGWVNHHGRLTVPSRCAAHWSHGKPEWFAGGWRNTHGQVTFPLARGGWSNGPAGRTVSYQGVTFAPGSSLPLHPYRTLAVDPRLIPRGSRVYIPAYRPINGGWFVAQDTGGAIIGRHVDVYRPPTGSPADGGRFMQGQRIYVVPPRH
jgi:3D (Asp-Asp-Asp) domain-containing protein